MSKRSGARAVDFSGPVRTRADRIKFFKAVGRALGGIGGFHPDTRFAGYVGPAGRVFSDAEARRLDALMEQAFGAPGDPYEDGAKLQEDELVREGLAEKTPGGGIRLLTRAEARSR